MRASQRRGEGAHRDGGGASPDSGEGRAVRLTDPRGWAAGPPEGRGWPIESASERPMNTSVKDMIIEAPAD